MLTLARSIVVLLLVACAVPSAWGTKIDQTPRPARLLVGSGRFLAQDSMRSVTLYASDGQPVHKFPTKGRPNAMDVTSDERQLLLADESGGVGLWSLDTGKPVWRLSSADTSMDGVYDACLSHDGRSCVVCNMSDFALILDARTGARVARVGLPRRETNVMSAALAPDGRTGVMVDLGGRVFAFDVASGAVRDTGLAGAWPIRFSADGRHAACRSNNSGRAEQLRVIAIDTWKATDVGRFSYIGHIRPQVSGGFHVTAQVDDRATGTSAMIGVRHVPGAAEPVEVWRRTINLGYGMPGCDMLTDFGGGPILGVSTDFRLVTHLTNLTSGEPVQVIDNSAHYQPTAISWSSSGPDWRLWMGGLGALAFILVGLVVWLRRGK